MITLWHPFESPTANTFHKRHWSVYAAWKRQCVQWAVFTANARGYNPVTVPVNVAFTAYRGRLIDTDNMIGGLKALRDALVIARFMKDDAPRWATFTYDQQLAAISPTKTPGTQIVIAFPNDPA